MIREWIDTQGAGGIEPACWLVKVTRDGAVVGWQYMDTSGLADLLAHQAYASFIDEEPDDIAVYRLADSGPCRVSMVGKSEQGSEFVEVRAAWRDYNKNRTEMFTYRIPGA